MAQFRASISGQRGEASKLGSKKSGIVASIDGWNVGVKVSGYFDEEKQKDVFYIYKSSGSNAREANQLIATVWEK